jgi:hypothetical protein
MSGNNLISFGMLETATFPVVSAAATAATRATGTAAVPEPIPIPVESAATAAGAKTTRLLLSRFIYCEGPPFQDLPVQLVDGSLHGTFLGSLGSLSS